LPVAASICPLVVQSRLETKEPCPPRATIKQGTPDAGGVVNLIVLVFSPPEVTIIKSEAGFCITPLIDTIKFAELPAGIKGVPPILRVKSVSELLN